MNILSIRLFFIFLSVFAGNYIGIILSNYDTQAGIIGAVVGLVSSVCIIFIENQMRKYSMRNLSAAVFGLVFGFFMAWIVSLIVKLIPMEETSYACFQIVFVILFCYLGMAIAIRGKDDFNIVVPYIRFVRQDQREDVIILDTSTIIDGRIADIAKTNFIDAKLCVPVFVLKELHKIADSEDALKRQRGRRGLDILNKIQKEKDLDVKVYKEDYDDIRETDTKLIRLAKVLSAKIFTNDYNLSKVAELEHIRVLNINDLSNALKTVYLPGEQIDVRIIKEGSEKKQGLAYLEDGTMIVVENAKNLIGRTLKVIVTSILQTSAGRMIFAEIPDDHRNLKNNQ
ncbi:MAG: hypothetical protein PHQ52_03570 [Candidatus Omnitrophica bacterium]|nr:hypothetical protein [Candidatus Omnitrophota bacterium]